MNRAFVFLALVCFSPVLLLGQKEKLGVTLASQQGTYSLHSDIQLTIIRENRGDQKLLVPRQWGWGLMRTDIRAFDADGNEVRTDFLADELPPPPQPYDFVLLEPGDFIGTHMGGPAKKFVNKPGEYEFVVEYTSYLSDDYAREVMKMPVQVPFWSREHGTTTSNRIKISITK
jgi:hypothetical protein